MSNPVKRPVIVTLAISGLLAVSSAMGAGLQFVQQIKGACQSVFEGEVCTWAEVEGDQLLAFGATVPDSTINNAPLDAEMVMPPITYARIKMPSIVKKATGIDNLGINWEAQGHPPATFLTPHFDFHFYTIGGDEVMAIDCSDTRKPDELPAGYVLPDMETPDGGTMVGVCVPQMGMHALVEEEMNAPGVFEATMVVGYYSQDLIFLEPMIARDKLLSHENFSIAVPPVSGRAEGLTWPAGFTARYDQKAGAYQFNFSMP